MREFARKGIRRGVAAKSLLKRAHIEQVEDRMRAFWRVMFIKFDSIGKRGTICEYKMVKYRVE